MPSFLLLLITATYTQIADSHPYVLQYNYCDNNKPFIENALRHAPAVFVHLGTKQRHSPWLTRKIHDLERPIYVIGQSIRNKRLTKEMLVHSVQHGCAVGNGTCTNVYNLYSNVPALTAMGQCKCTNPTRPTSETNKSKTKQTPPFIVKPPELTAIVNHVVKSLLVEGRDPVCARCCGEDIFPVNVDSSMNSLSPSCDFRTLRGGAQPLPDSSSPGDVPPSPLAPTLGQSPAVSDQECFPTDAAERKREAKKAAKAAGREWKTNTIKK